MNRRLTLLLPAAALALGLTACSGGAEPAPAPVEPVATSNAPQESTEPETGGGAPAAKASELVLTGDVDGVTFTQSDDLAGGGDLGKMVEKIEVDPAECKNALVAEQMAQAEKDVASGKAAMSGAQDGQSTVVAMVTETITPVSDTEERLEKCGEMTMDLGMGEPVKATLTEVDLPEAEGAEDGIGMTVTLELAGQTISSTQYAATVRERQIFLQGSGAAGGDDYLDTMDAAYTAQVEKVVAAE